MKRDTIFLLTFVAAAGMFLPAVPVWARGFGEVHGGAAPHGGAFSRSPAPSRAFHAAPAPHFEQHAAPRFEGHFAAPRRRAVEIHRDIGERVRPVIRPEDIRRAPLVDRARLVPEGLHAENRFHAANHWERWHSHAIDGRWYHGNWHGHWDNDWHSGWQNWWANPWSARPAFWGVTGWLLGAAVYDWGYLPYYNPYYSQPLVLGPTVIDYEQPVQSVDYGEDPADATPASDAASGHADAARQAFYDQNVSLALSEIEQALAQMPGDPALHEFRALVLFALGRYQQAAAAVHSILAVGPGWDWTTMISLYPNVDIYTNQLRALEIYRRDHPNAADARFLLAYHYLTMGHTPAAVRELREVVHLIPQDRVAAQLLLMITAPAGQAGGEPNTAIPESQEPGANAAAVDPAALFGNWTARREDGSTIQLMLTADGRFTWRFTQGGRTQAFSGTSTLTNNLLVLQRDNGESMVGRIVLSTPGRGFRFSLVGGPPNDPGLNFSM